MNAAEPIDLRHLVNMSDTRGLFEHAEGTQRRTAHGYCTDDNARMLVLTTHEPDRGMARQLNRVALRFVLDAMDRDGRFHNRMDPTRRWTDPTGTGDWWGRATGALGVVAVDHAEPTMRRIALDAFNVAAVHRPSWSRAASFAAIGAARVLERDPDNRAAQGVLEHTCSTIGPVLSARWGWPEARLAYANATLAAALVAAGAALGRDEDRDRGLRMLRWLLNRETSGTHLSVCGVGGCGPDDRQPMFDQQPIEVAAMAEACALAARVTGDADWLRGARLAVDWFAGRNDVGLAMYDSETGGGFDGLHHDGVNRNQGSESTIAALSVRQWAQQLCVTA